MREEIIWLLIYSALGLACLLMARYVRRLRQEWKQLKEEQDRKDTSRGEDR